jgi:hypothetical protein
MFGDLRAASSIQSLNHLTGQWLYFSKKKTITVADGMGIDGWEIDVTTEKNKNAPSQYTIKCIFDKSKGFDKFWTEYRFMSEMTPSENKIYKKLESQLSYPLAIHQSGNQVYLKVVDPDDHKSVLYRSDNMFKKNIKNLYDTSEEFQQWYDYAIEISSNRRIVEGLFKCDNNIETDDEETEATCSDIDVPDINEGDPENQSEDQESVNMF